MAAAAHKINEHGSAALPYLHRNYCSNRSNTVAWSALRRSRYAHMPRNVPISKGMQRGWQLLEQHESQRAVVRFLRSKYGARYGTTARPTSATRRLHTKPIAAKAANVEPFGLS